jgi:hypothetical protein
MYYKVIIKRIKIADVIIIYSIIQSSASTLIINLLRELKMEKVIATSKMTLASLGPTRLLNMTEQNPANPPAKRSARTFQAIYCCKNF